MKFDFDEIIDRNNTSSLKYDLRKQLFGREDVIPMWVADMDFKTPGFITKSIKERLNNGIFGYTIRNESYFTSIINWLQRRHNWDIIKDWIIYIPGVVPALNIAVLAFTHPGSKIIVQPPVYFPFFNAITDHRRTLVYNPLKLENNRLSMDLKDLEQKAKEGAEMIILSSPHNPGGSVWSKEELTGMAEICKEHNILILSDEIHCDLVYKPHRHIPVASLSGEIADITITCIAPSKTFNLSGLTTACAIISNQNLRKKFTATQDHLHIGLGNIFGNIASESAYTNGDEYDDQLMEYLKGNFDFLEESLKSFTDKIIPLRPEATFLVWLDCRAMGLSDEELKNFFINEAGLALNQGIQFGHGGEGFMRMNIGCPRSTISKAVGNLKSAMNKHGI
jgi:cysteine-S-conjugate beta-lyase